jgi:hypothetical protein
VWKCRRAPGEYLSGRRACAGARSLQACAPNRLDRETLKRKSQSQVLDAAPLRQDTLPEWSKGVDSSSTSASCVGSNPTGVIWAGLGLGKDDEFYLGEVLPLTRQLLHFHTLPLRPGQAQIEARIQLVGDREITLIQDHARAKSERTKTETAPVAREVRGVWAVSARRNTQIGAAIAQLGERLKVPGSIPGLGTSSWPARHSRRQRFGLARSSRILDVMRPKGRRTRKCSRQPAVVQQKTASWKRDARLPASSGGPRAKNTRLFRPMGRNPLSRGWSP